MMCHKKRMQCAISCMLLSSWAVVHAADSPRLERGELLYNNHCVACHTEQMHWREQRLVTDRATLTAQVQRWQSVTRARWNDEDVEAVVRYLNRTFYHFPSPREGG